MKHKQYFRVTSYLLTLTMMILFTFIITKLNNIIHVRYVSATKEQTSLNICHNV